MTTPQPFSFNSSPKQKQTKQTKSSPSSPSHIPDLCILFRTSPSRPSRKILFLTYNFSIKNPNTLLLLLTNFLFDDLAFAFPSFLSARKTRLHTATLQRTYLFSLFLRLPPQTTDLAAASLCPPAHPRPINHTHKATNQLSEYLQDPR